MPYVDLNTIHNPATGTVAPAAWGDQVRDDLEFLVDPPACSVFASSDTVVATATDVLLPAPSENFDNDAMHSTVTNTGRITIQTAGRYLFFARIAFQASTAGTYRAIRYKLNGGSVVELNNAAPVADASVSTILPISWTLVLAASDYVEIWVRQNTGGNLNSRIMEFAATYLTR